MDQNPNNDPYRWFKLTLCWYTAWWSSNRVRKSFIICSTYFSLETHEHHLTLWCWKNPSMMIVFATTNDVRKTNAWKIMIVPIDMHSGRLDDQVEITSRRDIRHASITFKVIEFVHIQSTRGVVHNFVEKIKVFRIATDECSIGTPEAGAENHFLNKDIIFCGQTKLPREINVVVLDQILEHVHRPGFVLPQLLMLGIVTSSPSDRIQE